MRCLLSLGAFTASQVCAVSSDAEPCSGHRADVVGAVSVLAGLLALKGVRLASINSMIL